MIRASLLTVGALLCATLLLGASLVAATSYDPEIALNSLYYCKAAYCNKADIAPWTCKACHLHPHFQLRGVYHNGTFEGQCFTGYDPTRNEVVVSFRGSADLANWIADFDFVFQPYPDTNCTGCEVHAGFYQVYLELANDVLNDVTALLNENPTASVLVTGHSLGAAISVHAGVDISRKVPGAFGKVLVYNFGEPRVGNPAFAAWAASMLPSDKQFRVTHAADPVPHLPPEFFGFLHTPHELWYDNNGNTSFVHCNDTSSSEDPKCSDSTIPIDVADHTLYLGIPTGCEDNVDESMRKLRVILPKSIKDRRVIVERMP